MNYCSSVLIVSLHLTAFPSFAQPGPTLDARLSRGDASALQEVAESRSMDLLMDTLFQAIRRQYGEQSGVIKEITAERLRDFPNHAAALGDEIDRFSEMEGTGRKVEHQFMILEAIGSPEAIAEIGRFVHDDRDPDKELFPPGSGFASISNSFLCSQIMGRLLGDKSPIQKEPGAYSWKDVRAIQEWWDSPASSEYRASLPPARSAIRVKRPFRGESLPNPGKEVEPVGTGLSGGLLGVVLATGATLFAGLILLLRRGARGGGEVIRKRGHGRRR
jgi:hypothetical protein